MTHLSTSRHIRAGLLAGSLGLLVAGAALAGGVSRPGTTPYYRYEVSQIAQGTSTVSVPAQRRLNPSVTDRVDQLILTTAHHTLSVDALGAAGGANLLTPNRNVTIRWISGEAFADRTTPFLNCVLVVLSGKANEGPRPYILGPNQQLTLNSPGGALYAFFPDWGSTSDNRGEAVLELTPEWGRVQTLTVDAERHAIRFDTGNTLRSSNLFAPNAVNRLEFLSGSAATATRSGRSLQTPLLFAQLPEGRGAFPISTNRDIPYNLQPAATSGALAFVGFGNTRAYTGAVNYRITRPSTTALTPTSPSLTPAPPALGSGATYRIRLSDLAPAGNFTMLLPVHLTGIYAGDKVIIEGAMPPGQPQSVGAVRIYVPEEFNGPHPRARAVLTAGNLRVDSPTKAEHDPDTWDDLVFSDFQGTEAISGGLSSVARAITPNTPFNLELSVAPYRDGRRGQPMEFYVGVLFAEDEEWAAREITNAYQLAADLPPISLNRSEGWYQD